MGDLLIAAAIDLGEGGWFREGRDRLIRGFELGKAGDAMDFASSDVTLQVMFNYIQLSPATDAAIFGADVEG